MNKQNKQTIIAILLLCMMCQTLAFPTAVITGSRSQDNPLSSGSATNFAVEYTYGNNYLDISFTHHNTTSDIRYLLYVNTTLLDNLTFTASPDNVLVNKRYILDPSVLEAFSETNTVSVELNLSLEVYGKIDEFLTYDTTYSETIEALYFLTTLAVAHTVPNMNYTISFSYDEAIAFDFQFEILIDSSVHETIVYTPSNRSAYSRIVDLGIGKFDSPLNITLLSFYNNSGVWEFIGQNTTVPTIRGYAPGFERIIGDPFWNNGSYMYTYNLTFANESVGFTSTLSYIIFHKGGNETFNSGITGDSFVKNLSISDNMTVTLSISILLGEWEYGFSFSENIFDYYDHYAYPSLSTSYNIGQRNLTVDWMRPELEPGRDVSYQLTHIYTDSRGVNTTSQMSFDGGSTPFNFSQEYICKAGLNTFHLVVLDTLFENGSDLGTREFRGSVFVVIPVVPVYLTTTKTYTEIAIQFYWDEIESAQTYYFQRSNTETFDSFETVKTISNSDQNQNIFYSFYASDSQDSGTYYYRVVVENSIGNATSQVVSIIFDQHMVKPQYSLKFDSSFFGLNPITLLQYGDSWLMGSSDIGDDAYLYKGTYRKNATGYEKIFDHCLSMAISPLSGNVIGVGGFLLFEFNSNFEIIGGAPFSSPIEGIAINASGYIYLSFLNSSLNVYSPDYQLVYSFGIGITPGKLYGPKGIYINQSGAIYIAESRGRISIFDNKNVHIRSMGEYDMVNPYGAYKYGVIQYKNLIIQSNLLGSMRIFTLDGVLVREYISLWDGESTPPAPGLMVSPAGFMIIDDILYMTDPAVGIGLVLYNKGQVHRLQIYLAPKKADLVSDKTTIFQGEQFELSWDVHENAANYRLYRDTSPITLSDLGSATLIGEYSSPESVIMSQEILGKRYFALVSEYFIGNKTISDSIMINCVPNIPDQPKFVTKSQITTGPITIHWDEVSYATNYTIYISTSPISAQNTGEVLSSGLLVNHYILEKANGTYYIAVEAFNTAGRSLSENVVIQFTPQNEIIYTAVPPKLVDPRNETDKDQDEIPNLFDMMDVVISGSIFGIIMLIYQLSGPVSEKIKKLVNNPDKRRNSK